MAKQVLPQGPETLLNEVWDFSLFDALFGRRARRFAYGMEIPHGPLAFKSRHAPLPLSELEQALLIAAGAGVSGWHFGIPHTVSDPGLSSYSLRLTGRTFPTGAGIGTPELFYTDDHGTYLVKTRDAGVTGMRECAGRNDAERVLARCRALTVKLSDQRLTVPREPPHISEHNLWNANFPGSTLFLPVGDVGQQVLAFLAIMASNGYTLYDDFAKRPAGNLEPYFRSGLLNEAKRLPLSYIEQYVFSTVAMELATMAQNIVLALQAVGLGGWLFTGINPYSAMGAFADRGVPGLGFRFVRREDWTLPNPVGLDGHYESLCPPYYPDMHAAVRQLAAWKFGEGGTYDPTTPGPYKDSPGVKKTVTPYGEEFLACLGETAQYVYDTYGKFPATVPTVFMRVYVQAHHLDTEFYDTHFAPGSYLDTHARHMERWHGQGRSGG
ncbi:MAG: hypothetical protein AB1671_24060 [Thermodesulfobacteriota bacterium]|jgi:hypothetical protein